MSNRLMYKGIVIAEEVRASVQPWIIDELIRLRNALLENRTKIHMDMPVTNIGGVSVREAERLLLKPKPYDCGTIACIGGHVALAHGMSALQAHRFVIKIGDGDRVWSLFYGCNIVDPANNNPLRVVAAIERWLAGSENPWNNAE